MLNRVIDKMIYLGNETNLEETEAPISIISMDTWEWAQGVGLYGLVSYYLKTKDESKLKFLTDWFDNNIKKGLPAKNVNTMCPMFTLAHLYEITGRDDYLQLCNEWAAWVMNEMPRTKEGGLQHIVSGFVNKGQVWDDTLFMTVLFLAKMGVMTNNKEYIDEAEYQFLLHIKFLTDLKTGLLFHGWTFEDGGHHFADALWGRGNCWLTIAIPIFLEMVDVKKPIKRFLIESLNSQVKALKEYQNGNGMWHTLVNDTESYVETSATAGFAYGILRGINMGIISAEYKDIALKAVDAVKERISDNGTVLEVSYGTGMGRNLDFYREIPICPMTYGQALAALLLIESEM